MAAKGSGLLLGGLDRETVRIQDFLLVPLLLAALIAYSARHLRDFSFFFPCYSIGSRSRLSNMHRFARNHKPALNLYPGSTDRNECFCFFCRDGPYILDLLEPAREDPAALVEAYKVLWSFRFCHCIALARSLAHAWRKCCRYDDEIFEHTLREFPEFAAAPHTSLNKLDEEWMKSKEGKERWRVFINACVSFFHPPHLRL